MNSRIYVRHLLASSAVLALISGAEPAAAQMPSPPYVWTGPYFGANLGFIQSTGKYQYYENGVDDGMPFSSSYGQENVSASGVLGGIQGGFNWQFPGTPWVVGVEADFDLSSASGTVNGDYDGDFQKHSLSALGTLRGRFGYAWDRVLFFGTGGLAFAHTKNQDFEGADYTFENASNSEWRLGWTVGGGMEYAVTNQISIKVEGLYVDLGSHNVNAPTYNNGEGGCTCTSGFKAEDKAFIGRVGFNFHF